MADDYWIKRAERIVKDCDIEINKMLKRTKRLYLDAFQDIEKEINAFYGKYAIQNKLTLTDVKKRLDSSELKSFKHELNRFYKFVDSSKIGIGMSKQYRAELREKHARMHISRLEQLKLEIKNRILQLGGDELEQFTEVLSHVFENTYSKSCYNIDQQRGYSVGFEKLNYKKVQKALEQKWIGDNYSGRIWKNKAKLINQLETTFLQGMVEGKNPREIGRMISLKTGASLYACERLARTEGGHIMGLATMDSYTSSHVKKYEYVATLDRRTSDVCKSLDGKIFLVKDAIEGVNYPEMHPNCRSTTIPYFAPDEFDLSYADRISKNGNKYVLVPANMTYEEWEKKVN